MKDRSSQDASRAPRTDWHSLPTEEVARRLETGPGGLSENEARARLQRYGANRLAPPKTRSPLMRLLAQFHNILLYVMLASSVITALLEHWVDAAVLLAAAVINAVIGFIQEGKAEAALDAIRAMLSTQATVIRDGSRRQIDAAELVPGDRVLLASGDRVPADLRLLTVRELRVEEATLTGESLPVEKHIEAVAASAPLGDRYDMAYSGTLVVYGQATGLVVGTGSDTELGQINRLLTDIRQLATPLLRQVDRFGRVLAFVILAVCALTFALGTLWRGHGAEDMFLMVVALAAAAIPEGLPAIMTVTLALGVQRMAQRNAIIRRLPAVETLGSVTVICSDKTGTLTRNEMTVQRVVCAAHRFEVGGVGYAPVGDCTLDGRIIDPDHYPSLALAIRIGVLCNDARLHERDGHWQVDGDPTEGALLVLGGKVGFTQHIADAAWPRLDSIPFESQHRFMASQHRDSDGACWLFVKGAPERLMEMCDHQLGDSGAQPLDADYWRRMATDIAARGLRLLALACKRAEPASGHLQASDMHGGFGLVALVGIIDPPREEAIAAVNECHRAGIQVKMITGDHAETARAIGAQLDIGHGSAAITGAEVALMEDAELRRVVRDVDVFARASPEHKLRLVEALQASGEGIVFIAVLFAHDVDWLVFALAAVAVAVFWLLSRWLHSAGHSGIAVAMGVVGVIAWGLMAASGIHATIAGVMLGLVMAPVPAERTRHALEPTVNGLILPVFAFVAAFVVIPQVSPSELSPAFWAILVALPVGKIIGITLFGWISLQLRPRGTAPALVLPDLVAAGVLGGIGFTVSLLLANLAFADDAAVRDQAILGVLGGSLIALLLSGVFVSLRARHYRTLAAREA